MFIKKGAMFGLDARIALAIFGALSVISGAALYSAIKDAREQRVITSVIELGKGLESYYLDTGVMPKVSTMNTTVFDIVQLIKNTDNIKGWKGPYISEEILTEDSATLLPRLEFYTYCGLSQTSNGITRPGYAVAQLRAFNNPNVTGVKDYKIHIQCIPNEIAETMAEKFNGKDVASSTSADQIYFNDFGTPADHQQIYFTIVSRKE
jgi:hypothetical protein